MPENLDALDPKAAQSIEEGGNRGDFMAVVQRPVDAKVSDVLQKHWGSSSGYGMLPFVINASLPTESMADKTFFVRSDHARFWFPNHDNLTLEGVWLTDTCKDWRN